MSKLISVVVPVCNEEKGIRKFLDERLLPELKKIDKYSFEVIIVNDGSKDKTLEIISDYAEE